MSKKEERIKRQNEKKLKEQAKKVRLAQNIGNRSRGGIKNALYEIPRKQHEKRYRFDFFRSFEIRKISISVCKSFSSQFKNHSLICQVA
ncbi:MAG: hypothetical protein PT118_11830 [Aphanizomenon gracile PMC644.10]|nr:hypothetical protein [Aphanizomenon gracile PMC644.10]